MNVLFCAGVRASEKYVWESAVASGEKRIMVTQVQNILVWQMLLLFFTTRHRDFGLFYYSLAGLQ